jgi:translation elongation factor EF-Ts
MVILHYLKKKLEMDKSKEILKLSKELRLLTGFGLMDCKRALLNSDLDMVKAIYWLENYKKRLLIKIK